MLALPTIGHLDDWPIRLSGIGDEASGVGPGLVDGGLSANGDFPLQWGPGPHSLLANDPRPYPGSDANANVAPPLVTLGLAFSALGHGPAPAKAQEEGPALPPPAARKVDFDRDIRPILAANCFACHGPEKQKSDFRLDDRAAAFRGGLEGPAIVPGKSAESELILRVATDEPDRVMPPKGDRLTAEQVGLLRAWIDQGATWPDHLAGRRRRRRRTGRSARRAAPPSRR